MICHSQEHNESWYIIQWHFRCHTILVWLTPLIYIEHTYINADMNTWHITRRELVDLLFLLFFRMLETIWWLWQKKYEYLKLLQLDNYVIVSGLEMPWLLWRNMHFQSSRPDFNHYMHEQDLNGSVKCSPQKHHS